MTQNIDSVEFWKKRCEETEVAYFNLTRRYQSEVGEPRRIILQAYETIIENNLESLDLPDAVAQVMRLVEIAAAKVSPRP